MKIYTLLFIFLLTTNLFSQKATVKFLVGKADVKSAQQKTPRNLSINDEIIKGNVIHTYDESICEILFPDGSVTKIASNSKLAIADIKESSKGNTSLLTGIGKFFFKIKKAVGQSFTVKTPTAVASIRGTEFVIENTSAGTNIFVQNGVVDFSDKNGANTVQVKAGQKSTVKKGQRPSRPSSFNKNDRKLMSDAATLSMGSKLAPPPPKAGMITEETASSSPITQAEQNTSESGFSMGAAVGAVSVDGEIYSQIGIRPEFSFGKFGMMLDLSLYLDGEGNIATQFWDSPEDILEKIYYMRWGKQGDPFYAHVGALDNYRLGYGILMNRYANTIQYPSVIRVGAKFGFKAGNLGMDVMINNLNESFDKGGLYAGRLSYDIIGDLQIGVSAVYDRNQYKGLRDKDGDGVPNEIDDFPDDPRYSVDTDGNGVPDQNDPDRDGNGYTDNLVPPYDSPPDSSILNDRDFSLDKLKKAPFNTNQASDKEQIAFAVDISYPVIQYDYLNLIIYSQAAKFGYDGGYGFTVPGILAKFLFVNLYGEYRIFGEKFLPEYFNTTYEVDRSVFIEDSTGQRVPHTKRDLLMGINQTSQGYVVGADFNLSKFLIFGTEFQDMFTGDTHLRTLRANFDINTTFIPKINRAGAYYYQNHVKTLFELSPGTILGYQIEYEIAAGAAILLDFRQTFWDKNGDGIVTSSESDKTTILQTVFRF